MLRYLTILAFFLQGLAFGQSSIVLTEMMSDNETTIADDLGNYEDWIELYNSDSNQQSLQGLFLSDDPEEPQKWAFPSLLLKPDSFLLVFASGRDTVIGKYINTNFKIDADGEWIYLFDGTGVVADSLLPVDLDDDISFGRRPDGSESYFTFEYPTPGSSNNYSNSLSFSHDRGF